MTVTVGKKKNGRKILAEQKQGESMGVRLPLDLDQLVRQLPNRSEYFRQAIIEKLERDGYI